jgi:type IV pilus biogenesis protein CpaD/CtpE
MKSASKTLQLFGRALTVATVAATLAGCALDDFAKEDTFEPYGGSKQHPIKVVNGKAIVDKCGDWSENVVDTGDNSMTPNHGCSVQSNIATMAAYPNDLVLARRMSRPPADGRVAAIKKTGGSTASAEGSAPASPTP